MSLHVVDIEPLIQPNVSACLHDSGCMRTWSVITPRTIYTDTTECAGGREHLIGGCFDSLFISGPTPSCLCRWRVLTDIESVYMHTAGTLPSPLLLSLSTLSLAGRYVGLWDPRASQGGLIFTTDENLNLDPTSKPEGETLQMHVWLTNRASSSSPTFGCSTSTATPHTS